MIRITCGLVMAAAVVGGCASNEVLSPPEMFLMHRSLLGEDANQARRLEKALTSPDIADLLDADIRAKLPTPLAVAKVKSCCAGNQPYLDVISAEELQGWTRAVEAQPQIKGVRPISNLTQDSPSVTMLSLRRSAAKMGCELLLVYLQGDSTVDNYNDAAVLYWTVIGLWLVPGNTYQHLTVMQAIIVDSRTGAVLGTATGEGRLSRLHAAAYKDITRDQLAEEAPQKALAEVQKAFAGTLHEVVQAADHKPAQAKSETAGGTR